VTLEARYSTKGLLGGAEECLFIGKMNRPAVRRDQIRNWFGFAAASSSLILSSVLFASMTKLVLLFFWSSKILWLPSASGCRNILYFIRSLRYLCSL